MNQKTSKALKFTVSVPVAAAFLFWAFRNLDFAEFWDGLCQTRWGFILLSVVAAIIALVFRAERWRLQLNTIVPCVGRIRVWDGNNIGNLFNLLLPGVGEFVRCGVVRKEKSLYEKIFGTILVERSFDVLSVLILFFISFLLQKDRLSAFVKENIVRPLSERFNLSFFTVALYAFFAVALLCLIVWLLRKRSKFCRKLVNSVYGILAGVSSFGRMRQASLFLLYTIGIWFMYILMSWFTFLAVPGLEVLTFSDAMFISAVGNLASIIPTPGNLGPYHWLVGIAISDIYLASDTITSTALLFATLGHGSHAVLLIVLGIISYICNYVRKN